MRVFEVSWPGAGRLAPFGREPGQRDGGAAGRRLRHAGFAAGCGGGGGVGARRRSGAADRAELAFHSHPIPDFSLPRGDGFIRAVFELHEHYRAGKAVAAHCRGSVGRSPLLASIMTLDGGSADDVWQRISQARGVSVPDTDAQRNWVRGLPARPRN